MHPDNYVQIMDRKKDIIISGGENISTVEIENTIFQHPEVMEVAVIAVPHPKWGERFPRPLSYQNRVPIQRHRILLISAKKIWHGLKHPRKSRLKNCPKPPRAKSRNSNCVTGNGLAMIAGCHKS